MPLLWRSSPQLLVVDREWHFSLRHWFVKFTEGAIVASKQIAVIASVIICAGIIIGVLNITGVGVKITSAILILSGGKLWIALILTAFACLILGMEVPTTAAYIICVSVAGPILQEYGLPALETHLFIFWFALLSTITPPVCGTVFIAAGMADSHWLKVASKAMRLGIGLYIIPIAFITNSFLIHPETNFLLSLLSFVKITIAGDRLLCTGQRQQRMDAENRTTACRSSCRDLSPVLRATTRDRPYIYIFYISSSVYC